MGWILVRLVEGRLPEPGLDRTEELQQFVVGQHFRFEVHGESLARAAWLPLPWIAGRAFGLSSGDPGRL